MALTRITKGVIKPNENYDTHNINSTGIVTAIGLDVNGNGDISGNLNVGGVLTYEDVTSIDSVGIITAQKDIHVGAGVSAVGVGTFGSLDISGDVDVDGHTNLDNVSIAGVTTFASSIQVADSIIHEGDTDTKIDLANNQLKLTAGNRLRVDLSANHFNYFYGTNLSEATSTYPKAGSATYVHRFRDTSGDDTIIHFHNTNVKNTVFEWNAYGNTSAAGNLIFRDLNTGKTEYARFTGTGSFNIAKDLDVDGHTNLDNVSIAGVATATTFVGALTGTASGNPTLSNGADNRIITATGANTLTGESNLTWTGSYFETNGSAETWTMRARSGGPSSKIGFQNQYLANGYTIGCGAANQSFVVYTGGNNDRLRIDSTGITTFSQNLFASKDFDVDGHTNLDNVSVAGIATFASDVAIGRSIYHINDIDTTIGFPAANQVEITAGNEEVATFTNSVAAFNKKIQLRNSAVIDQEVSESSATVPTLRIRNTGNHTLASFQNTNTKNTIIQWNDYSGSAGNLIFRSSNSGNEEHARFTSAGNFNLLKDLDVDGHTNLDNVSIAGVSTYAGQVRVSDGTTSVPSVAAASDTNSGLYFPGADAVGLVAGGSRKLLVNSSGVTINNGDLAVNGGNLDVSEDIRHIDNTNTKISFTSNTISFDTAGDERLRIDNNGRVIIGGSSAGPYHQDGDEFNIYSTGNTGMSIFSGTSSLGSLFFADDNNDVHGQRRGAIQYNHNGNSLSFWTNASPKLTITSAGNVGINETSNINGRLHVQHDALGENILYATRYNDQSNDKPILAVTEASMTGMTASGLVIGTHNRGIHIGPVFEASAAVNTAYVSGIRILYNGKVGVNTSSPSQQFTSYASSGYPILANGPSNGIGIGGNGAIVFGTRNLASYGPGILDGSTLEFKISGTPKLNITSGGQVQISGGSTPLKVTHTGADCAQFHRGSKYLGINADWGGNTGDSVISVSTNFVVHSNGSSERFRIASDGTATFGNNTNNGTYVTIEPVANNGRVRIGHPLSAVAKGKVIIDNEDRNALADLTDPDNYGVVLCGSPTTGHGNGITFCNDNAQNAGAGIVHVDEGSNNLGSLRFYTKDEGQVPYETLRMGKYGNLVNATGTWRAASEKYVNTLHMPQAHEGYSSNSAQSGLSVAAEMWHQSHVRGTSHLTTELFSTRMGHNAGMFIFVEVWFSCAVSNYQGYQALWANANRTGSNNFTINNTGQEGHQLGTDTGNYFELTYASSGSGSNQRLTWKVTTSFGQNYVRCLYKSTVVGHDYFTDLTVIR